MRHCDVFLSYSAVNSQDRWVAYLEEALKDAYKAKHNTELHVYAYQSRPNEDIAVQISIALGAACFVPVLNRKYFASYNCFEEWRAFLEHEKGRKSALKNHANSEDYGATRFVVPIWRGDADSQDFSSSVVKQHAEAGTAKIASTSDSIFGQKGNVTQEMTEEWVTDLTRTDILNFGQLCDASQSSFKTDDRLRDLVNNLVNKLHPLVEKTREIKSVGLPFELLSQREKLLGICAFGLRLDRYEVGGWGFSMGREYERDVDGEFLKHGRHEVNLLVARALRSFLDKEHYKKEVNDSLIAFHYLADSRRAPFAVKDRKDEIAALLAGISSEPSLRGRVKDFAGSIKSQVEQNPFGLRWVIDQKNGTGSSGDEAIFLDFISRTYSVWKEASSEIGGDLHAAIRTSGEKEQFEELLETRLKESVEALRKWISGSTNVFSDCAQQSFDQRDFLSRTTNRRNKYKISYEAAISELLLLRIAASLPEGARAIFYETGLDVRGAAQTRVQSLAQAIKTLPSVDGQPSKEFEGQVLGFLSLLLLVVDDIAHHTDNNALKSARSELVSLWSNFFDRSGSVDALLAADCVTWASIILVFERFFEAKKFPLPSEIMNSLWRKAGEIRNDRAEAIRNVLKRRNGGVKPEMVRAFYDAAQAELHAQFPQIFPSNKADLFATMKVFGSIGDAGGVAEATLLTPVGKLEVDQSDRIMRANEAFNLLYMVPFAKLSGIGITSVERLIHEFGDQDRNFIEVLGETVVQHCMPLGKRADGKKLTFSELSENVQMEVERVKEKASTGYGLKDLIVLRPVRAEDEPRIVLRICSKRRLSDFRKEHGRDAIFCTVWTFVDITSDFDQLSLLQF